MHAASGTIKLLSGYNAEKKKKENFENFHCNLLTSSLLLGQQTRSSNPSPPK